MYVTCTRSIADRSFKLNTTDHQHRWVSQRRTDLPVYNVEYGAAFAAISFHISFFIVHFLSVCFVLVKNAFVSSPSVEVFSSLFVFISLHVCLCRIVILACCYSFSDTHTHTNVLSSYIERFETLFVIVYLTIYLEYHLF